MIEILAENPEIHAQAVEDLFDRTFGPGHFAKTAERLREFSCSLPGINRVAVDHGQVVGVCRVWPLRVGPGRMEALFYGPVAVDPAWRGNLLSLSVTQAALEAGCEAGWPAAILIGARSLFGRVGFIPAEPGRLVFPGPQDPARVMVRDLAGDASRLEGLVTAA